MNRSDSIAGLAEAMSKFQGEVTNAFKSSSGHGYNYADLGSILDSVRPILSANGLSVVQMPSPAEAGHVGVVTCLQHKTGEWIECDYSMPIPDNKRNSAAQNVGSAITYARRYALAAALGVAQTDDDASLHSDPQLNENAKQWIAAINAGNATLDQIDDVNFRNFIAKELTK